MHAYEGGIWTVLFILPSCLAREILRLKCTSSEPEADKGMVVEVALLQPFNRIGICNICSRNRPTGQLGKISPSPHSIPELSPQYV